MKGLSGLIRIEQQRVETRRKALADLERLAVQCRHQLETLDQEVATESRLAAGQGEAALALGGFLSAAAARRTMIVARIERLAQQIDLARTQLADAYREQRKYELAYERACEAEAVRLARRERAAMDDMGLRLHRLKTKGRQG